jgi:hypothetical protein
MAVPPFPLWSIRPDWTDGIIERLEWLTDVLPSEIGVEQRRALRLTPRRYMEANFSVYGADRTFLESLLQQKGRSNFLIPLWHDKVVLPATLVGGTTYLPFDNTRREFTTGGYAVLMGDTTFDFEILNVIGQDQYGIQLEGGLGRDWGIGSTLHPLRVAVLVNSASMSNDTSRIGKATVLFRIAEANPYPAEHIEPTLADWPILIDEPDRTSSVDRASDFLAFERDNQVGIPYRRNAVNMGFAAQSHNWPLFGLSESDRVRRLLYALAGRRGSLWLPTFNDDVILTADAAAGAGAIEIEKIGFGYLGGAMMGRRNLFFRSGSDWHTVEITGTAAGSSRDTETLLVSPLARSCAKGASGSFLDTVRLDSDNIEIIHRADNAGFSECSVSFRRFDPNREV